jgi:hypothetical protein
VVGTGVSEQHGLRIASQESVLHEKAAREEKKNGGEAKGSTFPELQLARILDRGRDDFDCCPYSTVTDFARFLG